MNFPEKVVFRLIDSQSKDSISNVAVLLILFAHKKNNYSIEAKISNSKGEVTFTKDDCIKGIEASKSFYIMDYSSSLEECLPLVSLEVISRDTISFVFNDRKKNKDIYKNYWDCSNEFLNSLNSTDNSKFVSKTYNLPESELWQNEIIEIALEKEQ